MPADIAVINGQDAVALGRCPAWHHLGTTFETDMTVVQALVESGCDFEVRTVPAFAFDSAAGKAVRVPDMLATVRDDQVAGMVPLGIVSKRYEIIQNTEAFEFASSLVDSGEALVASAGALGRGERVFLALRLPEDITVGGEDAHGLFLGLVTGHDGHTALTACVTPVRFVCSNTVRMGLAAAKQSWSIRHTSSVQGRIAEAREALALSYRYAEAFQVEAEAMLRQQVSSADWGTVLDALAPIDGKSGRGLTIAATTRDNLSELFYGADTQANCRGTAWGAFQAVTEFVEFYRPVRNESSRRIAAISGTHPMIAKAQAVLASL